MRLTLLPSIKTRRSVGSVFQTLFAHYTKLSACICAFLSRPSAHVSLTIIFYAFFPPLSLVHGSVLRRPLCGLITLSCMRSLWDCNSGFKRCRVPQKSLRLAYSHALLSLSVWLICRVGRGNAAKAVVGRRMACGKCTKGQGLAMISESVFHSRGTFSASCCV